MSTTKTIWTKKAWEQFDPGAESLHGPPSDRELYHNGDVTLNILNEEREEFELDTDLSLDTDVLEDKEWNHLIGWLTSNGMIVTDFKFDDAPSVLHDMAEHLILARESHDSKDERLSMIDGGIADELLERANKVLGGTLPPWS